MQVTPIWFECFSDLVSYTDKWNLSDTDDIKYRFDTYISEHKRLGSWSSNGTLDEYFLTIF